MEIIIKFFHFQKEKKEDKKSAHSIKIQNLLNEKRRSIKNINSNQANYISASFRSYSWRMNMKIYKHP
jgi:hypothetical protein